ncbi:hypothetical protein PSK37_28865 [Escherichia coli]|nr:hypothetical protein [Escherichia coli]
MATRSLTRCIGFSPVTQQIRRSYVINLAQDVSDDEK